MFAQKTKLLFFCLCLNIKILYCFVFYNLYVIKKIIAISCKICDISSDDQFVMFYLFLSKHE